MLALFLLLLAGFGGVTQDANAAQVDKLLADSRFVFRGTVTKAGGTTMPDSVPASEGTAVVRIDEVLVAPDTLGDFSGREVTVLLLKRGSVKTGESAVFYTNGAVYGRSLAVREVGRMRAEGAGFAALREQVSEAKQRAADLSLARRLEQADVVVSGTVTLIREPRAAQGTTRVTEHDPGWREAVVRVGTLLKGASAQQGEVTVLFPTSTDVMWYRAPRFTKGQQGVFILRREVKPELRLEGLTALDPLDFQPVQQLERIRRLSNR
jgi:hypothetical protein